MNNGRTWKKVGLRNPALQGKTLVAILAAFLNALSGKVVGGWHGDTTDESEIVMR